MFGPARKKEVNAVYIMKPITNQPANVFVTAAFVGHIAPMEVTWPTLVIIYVRRGSPSIPV